MQLKQDLEMVTEETLAGYKFTQYLQLQYRDIKMQYAYSYALKPRLNQKKVISEFMPKCIP